jgi:hypothetical protein
VAYEFAVTVVATREHYEADGSLVPPGTRRPADPADEVPYGWRLDVERVERVEVAPPPPEPKAPEEPEEPEPPRASPHRKR